MKKITVYLMLILAVFSTGCEDVIKVDLDSAPPILDIDAAINWKKGT